jgi:ribosomal protein S18 acetylase RimI-like enzyme
MKQRVEIRPIRIDDLRGVFILGTDRFGIARADAAVSWNEKNLAEIIADNPEVSFVAVYKRGIVGFIIGALGNSGIHAGIASIMWFCTAKSGQTDVAAELFRAFQQCLFEKNIKKINASAAVSNAELIELYKKFGFTETEQVLIMETFLSKNKKSGSREAED